MRRAHLLAVTTSALLGVLAGVVGGLAFDTGDTAADPLGLGVSQVNQPCTGKTLLIVARGEGAPQLGSTIATEGQQVRYLDTGASCDTVWTDPGKATPRYVAYLGPYDSPSQACPVRMSGKHRGGTVTRLNSGTTEPVQCLCYLDTNALPVLRIGMDVTETTGIYVRALQKLLTDLEVNPKAHQNGLYDLQTAQQVRQFQHDHAFPATGAVKAPTWDLLISRGCKRHSS
jgi:peptidoglycan hydrolase-like protein with peptidoglycan-binding domain